MAWPRPRFAHDRLMCKACPIPTRVNLSVFCNGGTPRPGPSATKAGAPQRPGSWRYDAFGRQPGALVAGTGSETGNLFWYTAGQARQVPAQDVMAATLIVALRRPAAATTMVFYSQHRVQSRLVGPGVEWPFVQRQIFAVSCRESGQDGAVHANGGRQFDRISRERAPSHGPPLPSAFWRTARLKIRWVRGHCFSGPARRRPSSVPSESLC